MKRSPLPYVCSAFLIAISVIFLVPGGDAGHRPAKVRRNHRNSTSGGSPDIFMVSDTTSPQEFLLDDGETVLINCPVQKTTFNGCEWFKKSSPGGNLKRITQFFGRYQRITPCQLQILSVSHEDAGEIICKAAGDTESLSYTSQLTVTGQEDPLKNVLPKPSLDSTKTSLVPLSEPEITKELLGENRAHKVKGENISVKCEATGNPKPLVSWRRGSKNYTEPTVGYSHLKLTNLTTDDSGSYKCEAVNIFGRVYIEMTIEVRGALQGSAEILDVTPRNLTLYEGSQGNVTCIARFEVDPWFGWVKKIDNKTADTNTFNYKGNDYSVLPRTEIRPYGDKLYASTLFLQNVTTESAGVYHCIVAGLQGYNHSDAYVVVEKDPSKLHNDQIRRHKVVAILWIFSFVIFAALVILCFVRFYGCPTTTKKKSSSPGSVQSSGGSDSKKIELPKRSPETMSTDCPHHPHHEVCVPLMPPGSFSLASQEPNFNFKDCNSSCRTTSYSYDPECSIASSADSYMLADLEAARSSFSHTGSCHSDQCLQSPVVTSPVALDYYERRQRPGEFYREEEKRRKPPRGQTHNHQLRHHYLHHNLYPVPTSESNEKLPNSQYHPGVRLHRNHHNHRRPPLARGCTPIECYNCHSTTYDPKDCNLSAESDCESQLYSQSDRQSGQLDDQSDFEDDEGHVKFPSPTSSFVEHL